MATITTINGSDGISPSRTVINTNFANLNTDKIETSVLDTDSTLTANSDAKVATQKAVKAYIDAGGNPNASTTQAGIVEEATQAELTAGTQAGGSTARLFLNPVHTVSISAGASDAGKLPRLNASGVLDSTIKGIATTKSYSVSENMNGTTTPVAVCIGSSGNVQKAQANSTGTLDKFIGFCSDNITSAETAHINSSQASYGTLSFTAQAGNNRVVIVHIGLTAAGTPTNATSVTYNGNPMTNIQSVARTGTGSSTWYAIIGSNASSDGAVNIVPTGAVFSVSAVIQAACYGNANQSNPIGQKVTNNGSSTNPNATLDPSAGVSLVVNTFTWGAGTFTSWNVGQTTRQATMFDGYIGDVQNKISNSVVYNATVSSAGGWTFQAFELTTPTLPTSNIQYDGNVTFSGLTPNAKYYLQNTAGTIGTSAGSTTVLLGKALSSTELVIIQS